MAAHPVQLRVLAASDIDAAIEHHRQVSGGRVALEFVDALEHAIGQIARSPRIGSLRFAYDLAIPGLRAWNLRRFPYLIFYVSHDDHVDVWRILHTKRDIPSAFTSAP